MRNRRPMMMRWAQLGGWVFIWLYLAGPGQADLTNHPILADAPANHAWHAPADLDEAVFIGDASKAAPQVVVRKDRITEKPLVFKIVSDTTRCVVTSGEERFAFAVTPGRMIRVTMDGHEHRPTLKIDGQQPAQLQGHWIRLALHNDQPTFSLTLTNATYASIRFGSNATAAVLPEPSASAPSDLPDDAATRMGADHADSDHHAESRPDEESPTPKFVVTQFPPPAESHDDPAHLVPEGAPTWIPSMRAGVTFTNAYFYRGIGQEDNDVIIQAYADVVMNVIQDHQIPYLKAVDLHVGAWSSHHFGDTGRRGSPNGEREKFFELDFKGGVTATIFDRWAIDLSYLNRIGINNRFGDVHQIELSVLFDDGDPNYDFQLWPHALMIFEFEGESDAGFDSGIYLEVGIRPEFELIQVTPYHALTLAVPVTLGLSLSDYYQDDSGDDDIFGFLDIGAELSFPILIAGGEASGRRFVVRVLAGIDLLILGNNTQRIGELNGTGGDSVEVIGKIGFELNY